MDPRQVAKLRELLRAATPIPWTLSSASQEDAPNAALIVAAVNALPVLLSSPDPVAGDGLATWARWIIQQTRRTDWACRECVDADVRGQDNLVIAGFRCVWHEATAALAAPLSSPVEPPPGLTARQRAWTVG